MTSAMNKHCSYMGRSCPARPECAEHSCEAALAFPIGSRNEADDWIDKRNTVRAMQTYIDETMLSGVFLGDRPLMRKPQVTVNDEEVAAAVRTLRQLGYTYEGGEQWKPPLGPTPSFISKPQPVILYGKLVEQGILSLDASNGELGVLGLVIERPDPECGGLGGHARVTISGLSRHECRRLSASFLENVRLMVEPKG